MHSRSEELLRAGLTAADIEADLEKFRLEQTKAAKMIKAQQSKDKHADPVEHAKCEHGDSDGEAVEAAEAEIEDAAGSDVSGEAAPAAGSEPEEAASPKGPAVAFEQEVPSKAAAAAPPAKKPRVTLAEGPNRQYLSEVQDDLNTVLCCKAFKDIVQAMPIRREDAECGIQEPFNSGMCRTALCKRGTYISGFNFFWLDLCRSITPGIPLSRQRVRELADWMFKDGLVPLTKAIGVFVSSADFRVLEHKGSLLMITPEERAHAILLKVADDVRKNGARRHKDWKLVLLSVPVYIDVIAKEEQVQWEAFNARQLILQEHWSMARTAQQQCYEVVSIKNGLQKDLGRQPTRKEISDKFRHNVKMAPGRKDDYSETFVREALNIYDKVLCCPPLAQVLLDQEMRDGQNALWNHMGKLSVLATKTVDPEERKWVMDALEDLQINSSFSSDDLSRNILLGDKTHVGMVPLLTFKYKLLARLVGYWFTAIGLRVEDVAVLQDRTKSHSFIVAATAPDSDQSWLGRLQPSSVAAFRLLEASV